ncbi:hypothetical protein F4777DRAFT_299947 [Nemania sp. FL0916]|nr:hypothetical protein F4777DRAFT_299947 [Nemania sp. FL0916]
MPQKHDQAAPFRERILNDNVTNSQALDHASLGLLFPASYLTEQDDLAPPKLDDIKYFEDQLGVGRLGRPPTSTWLWIAGRPVPPRALHHQLLLGREIVIVEQMDLHLVWTSGRMFLKPLPRYLLEPSFWTTYLTCAHDEPCTRTTQSPCAHRRLWRCALGFLFSYAALVRYESDFQIAQEKRLIPIQARWQSWRRLVAELDTEHIYGDIDPRYVYGELRLSRLNKIQYLHWGGAFRGYLNLWQSYGDFLSDNFTWVASAAVFVAIVLTAMQVGLGTDRLQENGAFQSASYGFTVFSIVGLAVAVGLIFCAFLYAFIVNLVATIKYGKRRFLHVRGAPGAA